MNDTSKFLMHWYEYIWLDANLNPRSKVMITNDKQPPVWNYDGSSTGQATVEHSEIELYPEKVYRSNDNKNERSYVICRTSIDTEQMSTAKEVIRSEIDFGLEQEFFIYGGPDLSIHSKEQHYCGVGRLCICSSHRTFIEQTIKQLLSHGVQVTGYNFEVAHKQAEIQIRNKGIDVAHDLILTRYLLLKNSEQASPRITIIFDPKPFKELNGSGCHVNFSTPDTMSANKNGLKIIWEIVDRLKQTHTKDIQSFGSGNEKRLTGTHETSNYHQFNAGIGSRNTSIRISRSTVANGAGYIEDRRPASNMNPYQVLALIARACRKID